MGFLFYLKLCGFAAMGLVAALVLRRGLAECHERVRRMSAFAAGAIRGRRIDSELNIVV